MWAFIPVNLVQSDFTAATPTKTRLGIPDSILQCPAGRFLSDASRATKKKELYEMVSFNSNWHTIPGDTKGDRWKMTGVSNLCSSNFPKPPVCSDPMYADSPQAQTHNHRGDAVWHSSFANGHASMPLRTIHGPIEFIHNYKVASSSIAGVLSCEYGSSSMVSDEASFSLSVFAVRDPIDRFISAMGEIMQRYMNDICPGQPGVCNLSPEMKKGALFKTRFYPLISQKNLSFVSEEMMPRLVQTFISDLRCCHGGYASDHLTSQSVFATYALRGIDVLLHLESLWERLQQVHDMLGHERNASRCDARGFQNDAASKPKNVPSSAMLRAAITPSQIQQLCAYYMKDYICFDLPLPKECCVGDLGAHRLCQPPPSSLLVATTAPLPPTVSPTAPLPPPTPLTPSLPHLGALAQETAGYPSTYEHQQLHSYPQPSTPVDREQDIGGSRSGSHDDTQHMLLAAVVALGFSGILYALAVHFLACSSRARHGIGRFFLPTKYVTKDSEEFSSILPTKKTGEEFSSILLTTESG